MFIFEYVKKWGFPPKQWMVYDGKSKFFNDYWGSLHDLGKLQIGDFPPSRLDPNLAPPGYHALHAYTPATEPWEDWAHLDERLGPFSLETEKNIGFWFFLSFSLFASWVLFRYCWMTGHLTGQFHHLTHHYVQESGASCQSLERLEVKLCHSRGWRIWSCLIPGRVKNTRRRKKPKNSCMQLLASRCLISKMLVSDIFSIYFLTFSHIFSVFCMCPASNRRKFTATPYTTGPGGARTGGDAFDAPSLLAKTLRELRPGASAEFLGKSWDVSMVLWCPMDIYEYLLISLDIYGLWTGIGIVFGENSGKLWENWYAIICLRCGMWLCRKRAMFRNWRATGEDKTPRCFGYPVFGEIWVSVQFGAKSFLVFL